MDLEQLDILEKRIDDLLGVLDSLKRENESLREKVQIQESKILDLQTQVETLKTAKENARMKLVSLLDKLERIGS